MVLAESVGLGDVLRHCPSVLKSVFMVSASLRRFVYGLRKSPHVPRRWHVLWESSGRVSLGLLSLFLCLEEFMTKFIPLKMVFGFCRLCAGAPQVGAGAK